MPALFVGHGSPMNAIATNKFTKMLSELGKKWPSPKAVLVVSAHWLTSGTWITSMVKPKTIHDFYGFPQELMDVQYPAPGSPEIASLVNKSVSAPRILLDLENWGLDHGAWSVLRHMYPDARIPILQLSLDRAAKPEDHFKIGEQLRELRKHGVMILGSGNIVHNLRLIQWETNAPAYDWAIEFDQWVKQKIVARDYKALMTDAMNTQAGRLSVPTSEHYDPLLYILGAADPKDELHFEYEEIQNASISMRCLSFS
ncbi:MAG: 4,5-DOPA dioxygenase extradiol [Bdellovibrionaceae bacterium]|nr:4,5-DOPA dioxygenase extradiol [Pseudobdellovibrionaceae bacterium]